MRLNSIVSLWGLLALAGSPAQKAKSCTTSLSTTGSVPPMPALYSCVTTLNGRPYDSVAAKSCLNSILASGYFKDGHLDVASGSSSVTVRFSLAAPPLTVKDLDFEVQEPDKHRMLEWIIRTGQVMKPGELYDVGRDDRTIQILGMFFWDIGKRAGVTRDVNLDYQSGTAKLSYRITLGPDMVPIRALPPFEAECPIRLTTFNRTDVDDNVPINLVDKMTKTHAFECFDPVSASGDQKTLAGSGLFTEARYEIRGGARAKQVYLHMRGRRLKVKEVRIAGYGLLANTSLPPDPALGLQADTIYRRSAANACVEYLQGKYAQPNETVEVYEDDQLAPDNQIVVTFQILAYDQDLIVLNGKDFHVPPMVISGHS
jgi:hypothetical protein